jgi:hypothetical protein
VDKISWTSSSSILNKKDSMKSDCVELFGDYWRYEGRMLLS